MNEKIYDMLVVGGGPGGYTAALYAARAGMSVLVLEKMAAGGQMAVTPQIDNYPGFTELDGFMLGQQMKEGAEKFGAQSRFAEVTCLHLEGNTKSVDTTDGVFYGKTVVIATGAHPRKLHVPGEQELFGRGVHYCAACDGMFYRGKTVAVVGGGNTAAAAVLVLSRVASKVLVIHRRDTLRASGVYHKPMQELANVEVVVENVISGENQILPCDGVFVSVGRQPETGLVKGLLHLDDQGYIVADESTRTEIPGVFAVGDVRTKGLRQIVTAVADGATAVHYAEEYLATQ